MGLGMLMTGVASGFGKGLGKGLENYQSYLGASQLQAERQAYEDKRMERMEEFAVAREGRQMTHAETLQKGGFEHAEKVQEKGFGHAETLQKQGFEHAESMTGQQITSNEAMRDQDRAQADRHHQDDVDYKTKDLGLKEKQYGEENKLKDRELSIHEQHYKDMKPWYSQARHAAGKTGDPATKLTVDTLMKGAERGHQAAQKYEEAAGKEMDPARANDLRILAKRERDRALMNESQAFSMLGITPTAPSAPGGGAGKIVDPYEPKGGKSAEAKGEKPAEAKPNLPKMGEKSFLPNLGLSLPSFSQRTPFTTEDVAQYLSEHEAAMQGKGKVSEVVKKFKDRFGRLPNSEEMSAASRRGLLQTPAR